MFKPTFITVLIVAFCILTGILTGWMLGLSFWVSTAYNAGMFGLCWVASMLAVKLEMELQQRIATLKHEHFLNAMDTYNAPGEDEWKYR